MKFAITLVSVLISCGGLFVRGADPYFEMTAPNLNTMNSYFIPTTTVPTGLTGGVDLVDYRIVAVDLADPTKILTNNHPDVNNASVIHFMSSYIGVWIQLLIFLIIGWLLAYRSSYSFSQTIGLLYDGIYEFFEGIIGEKSPQWMKTFVVALFFILLFANGFGYINDIIRFFFPWWLRNVTAPTGELEFNVALAIVCSMVMLYIQYKSVGGIGKLIHEYVPVFGKGYAPSKFMDIVISIFVGFLDIIGFLARIVSLSLRLFGNMSAGSILLNVAFLGLSISTVGLLGLNIPVFMPLIVYLLGTITVLVQALVFSLIVAIGMKMSYGE